MGTASPTAISYGNSSRMEVTASPTAISCGNASAVEVTVSVKLLDSTKEQKSVGAKALTAEVLPSSATEVITCTSTGDHETSKSTIVTDQCSDVYSSSHA